MIRVVIVAMGSFLAKKVVKNRYYENENLGLAWDSIKWSQVAQYITTAASKNF